MSLTHPLCVYINWAAFDELSDVIEHTESFALKQLDQLLHLKQFGVQFDAYILDAFWYDPDSGYRAWRTPHWSAGPERFLSRCQENAVIPGLWFTTNVFCHFNAIPAWQDSVSDSGKSLCMFHGGFMDHFAQTLQLYYDQGFRMFKMDFADFYAAPAHIRASMPKDEIYRRNVAAWRETLVQFKKQCPEAYLLAYNGYGGWQEDTVTPFSHSVDPDWLDYFDCMYSGDPRPADLPCLHFWRSKDIYSDHMIRYYQYAGLPLPRIDNAGFSIGTTGCVFYRGVQAWKGMLLLSFARGGLMNTIYGDLELLSDTDADWFARVQTLFFHFQQHGVIATFGGIPGNAEPYGYYAGDDSGCVFTVLNPSHAFVTVRLPRGDRFAGPLENGRVLFRDAGVVPQVSDDSITLGPEQLAVVGFGRYADQTYDLGIQNDVVIPRDIQPLEYTVVEQSPKNMRVALSVPRCDAVLVLMRQLSSDGRAYRSKGGSPPDGVFMDAILKISATHNASALPVRVEYDKQIWCGLSWAAGQIDATGLAPDEQLLIQCSTEEQADVRLELSIYQLAW